MPDAERLLLLVPTTSYRTDDFRAAARRLGVPVVLGTDRCHMLEGAYLDRETLTLDFRHPERAAEQIAEAAPSRGIRGIVPVDETTAVIAALAAERLALPWNPPAAARYTADKHAMVKRLREAGVPAPEFQLFDLGDDPAAVAQRVRYPCVVKPLVLSASRGVIRADDAESFLAAWERLGRILESPSVKTLHGDKARQVLVERFVPGPEVAVEGLLRGGELTCLAVFDKPDPLDGPYFEETLYVTPSRHPAGLQRDLVHVTGLAARALGLREGPIHAELRLAPGGPTLIELAGRTIGGLCARTLRFGAGIALEELVVAHAMRLPLDSVEREQRAAGVMMIPIPRGGVLHGVSGSDAARGVPNVEDVVITVEEGREVTPLPEGDCYLGFVFARADAPADVERALREAHRWLDFDIRAPLPTLKGDEPEA